MARKIPLDKIQDAAVRTLEVALTTAKSAIHLAKGAVASLLAARATAPSATEDTDADDTKSTPTDPAAGPSTPEPVNVVEELGLDPAPFDKPKPNTTIDAAADPSAVDATPADVARAVSGKGDTTPTE
ncbi:hypothetical protein [Nocardioides alcanivorans]|uniref:hypothetical protein n=1 Tax=Nocardioides alcanivorans TaxID=2897352 RepID=UPI001F3C4A2B|nr:hypothetical protein [Nocardioides alcanivorans]